MNNVGRSGLPSPNLLSISIKARTIDDPEHVLVEALSGSPLYWFKVGMLYLHGEPGKRKYICDVFFIRCLIYQYPLLPSQRKFVLPVAVPISFGFPPWIAIRFAFVGPMMNPNFATASYHL
jgi:hypothetical protein